MTIAAQARQSPQQGHSHEGPVTMEVLQRPVTLRTGIGQLHEKVSTQSPEAQAFYDQGLSYLHSYVWIEASRSFHQALRADPNLAMAFLGLTDTFIGLHDVGSARATLERAKALEKGMSERERTWLGIRESEVAYLENSESTEGFTAYRKSINQALKANPNDPWLWIQRGLADEGNPFTHGQTATVDALAFYRTALALAPGNLAALHYSAHAYENMGRIKDALEASAQYARLAPAIPHAQHMHGHALMRSGRTQEAIVEFLKTKELEESYYRTEKIPARFDWHHGHNLTLLAMCYQSLGQMKSAEALFHELFLAPAFTDFLEYNRKSWPEFLLSRGRFQEALDSAREMTKSEWPLPRLGGHTLAGEALLAMGSVAEARDEMTMAERETEHLPPGAIAALPYPALLRVNILLEQKNTQEGEPLAMDVAKSLQSVPGPDAWISAQFELEAMAQSARKAGDWELAGFLARQMILHNLNYAGGHFAFALAAAHAGNSADAAKAFAAAEKLWEKADKDLPELGQIRKQLAANR
ncbi:MAG TPA: tetratricopeptide repeat protein [Candidatus Acidoferrum sp.]